MFDIKKFLEAEARLTSPYKSASAEHRPDTAMGTDKAPFKGKLVGSSESAEPGCLGDKLKTKLESEWNDFAEAVITPTTGTKPTIPGQTPPPSPQEKATQAKAVATATTALKPTGINPVELAKGKMPSLMKLGDVVNKIASDPATAKQLGTLVQKAVTGEGTERLKGSGRRDFSNTLGTGIGTNYHTYDEAANPADKVTLDIPLLKIGRAHV